MRGLEIVVFGSFRNFNGTPRPGLAYLDSNYNLLGLYSGWTSANTIPAVVYALAAQADGKVWVGGDFTGMGGKFRHGLARLYPDGTLDTSCNAGVDGYVESLALQEDGKLLMSGNFGEANGYARTSVARLNANASASLDIAFSPIVIRQDGTVGDLSMVTTLSNGQIVIAGDFSTVGGVGRSIAARLNSNGTLDNTFAVGVTLPGTNIVGRRVLPTADGKYLLLGNFLLTGGSNMGFLTRLSSDGVNDSTWGPNPPQVNGVGMDAPVSTLLLQPDGKILVCGDFTQIYTPDPNPLSHIARITADGQLDNTFIPQTTDNFIKTMALQPSGKVLIGGDFTAPFNRVARLTKSGSLDPSFTPSDGLDSMVWNIVYLPSQGKAILAGEFTTFNGYHGFSRPGITRLFASDGSFNAAIPLLLME